MKLPILYAIFDKVTLDARGIGVAAFARELRDAGVTLLQYRDKSGGPQEILLTAAEIAEVFAGVESTLILNDRADLAVLAGWGVHVGQGDLSPKDAKAVVLRTIPNPFAQDAKEWGAHNRRFPPGMTERKATTETPLSVTVAGTVVGVSTHNEAQVIAAEASEADYVAIGPVFRTSTKLNAEPVVGLEGVRRARALTSKPLVAIGGITRENARSVIDAGADSVAVIGGLLVKGERPGKVAEDFLVILR